jgi:hypothetical protein
MNSLFMTSKPRRVTVTMTLSVVSDVERDRDDDVVGGEWRCAFREVEARGGPTPVKVAEVEAQPDGALRERCDEAARDVGVPAGDLDVVAREVPVFALHDEVEVAEVIGGGVRPLPVDMHRQQRLLDVLQLLVRCPPATQSGSTTAPPSATISTRSGNPSMCSYVMRPPPSLFSTTSVYTVVRRPPKRRSSPTVPILATIVVVGIVL